MIVYEIVWVATIWEEQALGALVAACFCELNTSQDFASERRERQVEINEDPFSNHDLQMFFLQPKQSSNQLGMLHILCIHEIDSREFTLASLLWLTSRL